MKNYYSGIIALIVAMMGFGFTNPTKKKQKRIDTVILEFTGDPLNWWEVEDETLWVENPSFDIDESCLGNKATCAIEVEVGSLSGTAPTRYLNEYRLALLAVPGGGGTTYGYGVSPKINSPDTLWFQWYRN